MRKLAVLGIGLALLVTSCGGASDDNASEQPDLAMPQPADRAAIVARDAWSDLRIEGDEVEGYSTFVDMRDAADAVVVGAFTSFSPGRGFQGDAAEDQMWYINGTVEVSEVIRGSWIAPTTIEVEFVSSAPDEATLEADLAALNAGIGGGDTILFLRDKGGDEAGLLRLVNSYGLVTTTSEMPVDVPLGEVPVAEEANGLTEVQDPRSQWATLDEFITDMRS